MRADPTLVTCTIRTRITYYYIYIILFAFHTCIYVNRVSEIDRGSSRCIHLIAFLRYFVRISSCLPSTFAFNGVKVCLEDVLNVQYKRSRRCTFCPGSCTRCLLHQFTPILLFITVADTPRPVLNESCASFALVLAVSPHLHSSEPTPHRRSHTIISGQLADVSRSLAILPKYKTYP